MEIRICKNASELGQSAATYIASKLHEAIAQLGSARLLLSTGASQFDTLAALITLPVEWEKVEMFHLDEYVGLPETHPASFRRYLRERFINHVPLKAAHLVEGTQEGMRTLAAEIVRAPIDIGLIGVGENAHIAFNDPPADFNINEPYLLVRLNDACKHQQCGEGWFTTPADVPDYAVSMSVRQIMRCRNIVSSVPYPVKADAIRRMLTEEVHNLTPATILKTHPSMVLYLDQDSAAGILRTPVAWVK